VSQAWQVSLFVSIPSQNYLIKLSIVDRRKEVLNLPRTYMEPWQPLNTAGVMENLHEVHTLSERTLL